MSNHQYSVSVRPATQGEVSAAIEASIRAAFKGTGMPTVLVGTKNLAGELNMATVIEIAAPVIEDSEPVMIPTVDDVIIESAVDGDLVEVLGFTEDADGVVWAQVRTESGDLFEVPDNEWESEYGAKGELEIMAAYDRSFVSNLRTTMFAA